MLKIENSTPVVFLGGPKDGYNSIWEISKTEMNVLPSALLTYFDHKYTYACLNKNISDRIEMQYLGYFKNDAFIVINQELAKEIREDAL